MSRDVTMVQEGHSVPPRLFLPRVRNISREVWQKLFRLMRPRTGLGYHIGQTKVETDHYPCKDKGCGRRLLHSIVVHSCGI